jgi:hypothetical protein
LVFGRFRVKFSKTRYPDQNISWVSSVPPAKFWDEILKQTTAHNHAVIQHYITYAVDKCISNNYEIN